jgi:site-specific recombinase XerD
MSADLHNAYLWNAISHVDLTNEKLIFPGKSNKEQIVPMNQKALAIPRRLHINRVYLK